MKQYKLNDSFPNWNISSFLQTINKNEKKTNFSQIDTSNTSNNLKNYKKNWEIWKIIKALPFKNPKSLILKGCLFEDSPFCHYNISLPNDKSESFIWINSEERIDIY